ncbi:MAG: hypothetical protein H8E30_16590 [Alphaproteobacteria bacterium]|nr:hypothetical protein [Alphaproteobacteria bacterium]
MLAAVGGVERRLDEIETLFHEADFAMRQVVTTKSPLSILEVVPIS